MQPWLFGTRNIQGLQRCSCRWGFTPCFQPAPPPCLWPGWTGHILGAAAGDLSPKGKREFPLPSCPLLCPPPLPVTGGVCNVPFESSCTGAALTGTEAWDHACCCCRSPRLSPSLWRWNKTGPLLALGHQQWQAREGGMGGKGTCLWMWRDRVGNFYLLWDLSRWSCGMVRKGYRRTRAPLLDPPLPSAPGWPSPESAQLLVQSSSLC